VRVGPKVMSLDVLKVGCGLKSVILPIQPTQPKMDVSITMANGPNVTLEMADINRVESYDSYEEPDVSLSQAVADEIGLVL